MYVQVGEVCCTSPHVKASVSRVPWTDERRRIGGGVVGRVKGR